MDARRAALLLFALLLVVLAWLGRPQGPPDGPGPAETRAGAALLAARADADGSEADLALFWPAAFWPAEGEAPLPETELARRVVAAVHGADDPELVADATTAKLRMPTPVRDPWRALLVLEIERRAALESLPYDPAVVGRLAERVVAKHTGHATAEYARLYLLHAAQRGEADVEAVALDVALDTEDPLVFGDAWAVLAGGELAEATRTALHARREALGLGPL